MTKLTVGLAVELSRHEAIMSKACAAFCKRWPAAEYEDAFGRCALAICERVVSGDPPTATTVAEATQNALRQYQLQLKRWSRERASGSMDKWGGH